MGEKQVQDLKKKVREVEDRATAQQKKVRQVDRTIQTLRDQAKRRTEQVKNLEANVEAANKLLIAKVKKANGIIKQAYGTITDLTEKEWDIRRLQIRVEAIGNS